MSKFYSVFAALIMVTPIAYATLAQAAQIVAS